MVLHTVFVEPCSNVIVHPFVYDCTLVGVEIRDARRAELRTACYSVDISIPMVAKEFGAKCSNPA